MSSETIYEQALALYYRLRPDAINAYNNYFLTRCPAAWQADMDGILAPNLPKLMVSDGQNIPIKDGNGVDVPGSPGTAVATDQYSGYIRLVQP